MPGLLLVKLFDVGRDREERIVAAAVLSGPLAACIYWVSVLAGWDPLYWILLANTTIAAALVPWRSKRAWGWERRTSLALLVVVIAVLVPYLVTTGELYRIDDAGVLKLQRALQRDVLFHVGVTRSLEHGYPPSLLSVSAQPIGYHVGYHLQLAAWARFSGSTRWTV